MSGLRFPKGRPASLERTDRRKARQSKDEAESAKVKARSGGRCEVEEHFGETLVTYRCQRRAVQVHHMIGGWGKRARGDSLNSEHKQHVCLGHHADITGHILQRVCGPLHAPHWTDAYRRVR